MSPVEAILYDRERIAEAGSANGFTRDIKTRCDSRNENGQIKISEEPPREIEISFVRKGRTGSRRNAARNARSPGGNYGVVGNEAAPGKQWRGRFRSGTLSRGWRRSPQSPQRKPQPQPR